MHLWGMECATASISLQFPPNSHISFHVDASVQVKRVDYHMELFHQYNFFKLYTVYNLLCEGMGLLLH